MYTIREISGRALAHEPFLAHSMFEDRAKQFHSRLKWEVHVNPSGEERDEYDRDDTLYLIAVGDGGKHEGSMRFLPTTGNTMISDHFCNLVENVDFISPRIWECTRFCISRGENREQTALHLFAAGATMMKRRNLVGFIAVFDQFMERIYKRNGVSPEVMAQSVDRQGNAVKLGIWHQDNLTYKNLQRRIQSVALPKNFETEIAEQPSCNRGTRIDAV